MGYLQEVDRWLDELLPNVENSAAIKKGIKEKILESYRNGQKAPDQGESKRKPYRHGR